MARFLQDNGRDLDGHRSPSGEHVMLSFDSVRFCCSRWGGSGSPATAFLRQSSSTLIWFEVLSRFSLILLHSRLELMHLQLQIGLPTQGVGFSDIGNNVRLLVKSFSVSFPCENHWSPQFLHRFFSCWRMKI